MLKEYLTEFGFDERTINRIKVLNKNEKDLLFRIKIINLYFEKLGYSKEDIIKIISGNPRIYIYSVDNLHEKIKVLIKLFRYKNETLACIIKNPYLLNTSKDTILKKIEFFKARGFKKDDILEKHSFWRDSLVRNRKDIEKRIQTLKDLGFDDKRINKFLKESALEILYLNDERINMFKELGYNEKQIVRIFSLYPNFRALKKELITKKFNEFIDLGFTKEEIIRMTYNFPQIFGLSIETIKEKLLFLNNVGFKEKEIKNIIIINTIILSNSINTIKDKIQNILKNGFSLEEARSIVNGFPAILNAKTESVTKRIEFLKEIELKDVVLNDPKQLMQSVELTYARYMFLKEQGIGLDMNNYKLLFYTNAFFEQKYNISNEEIVKLYNYNENKNIKSL